MGTIPASKLKETVGIWEKNILALPAASNLMQESALKPIRKATGVQNRGYYIGLIDMVLREAAIRSLEKGLMYVDLEILQQVCEEYGG